MSKKYWALALLLSVTLTAGVVVSCSSTGRGTSSRSASRAAARTERRAPIFDGTESGSAVETSAAGNASAAPEASEVSRELAEAISELRPEDLAAGGLAETNPLVENIRPGELEAIANETREAMRSEKSDDPAAIDSLAAEVETHIPEELRSEPLHDSIVAKLRELAKGLPGRVHPDTLRTLAADKGIYIPDDADLTNLDIYEYPDVVEQTGGLVIMADTAGRQNRKKEFLDQPVFGKNRDSLIYDVKNRLMFVYGQGDLTYSDNNLKADHMIMNVETKEIFGVGVPDSTGVKSRPEFTQAGSVVTMDTITFNMASKKAKIKGAATKDGEGFLLGREMKRMPDNTINIKHAAYTTCDHIDHPHFYIAMTKAKVIPGKKIITGPAYFVMEDVPLYFLGIPGGFFPITNGPQSGFIMPTYGEEARRGFYLRDGGYYFTFGDYADLALTGSIYTLGSWGVRAETSYAVRYKFSGRLSANYEQTVLGEKNSTDYSNSGNFQLNWSHQQDPKFHPSSQFSASVNVSSANYSKNSAVTMQDHLNTQTNSSISYSKSWTVGSTPINLTLAFRHSQNSRDSTISLTLPDISFSVGSFAPFKRRNAVGKQRWYEKITISYSMSATNSTGPNTKERDLFTNKTLEELSNGIRHSIPIKTSFNILNYISFSPSFTYNEVWNFKRRGQVWDPQIRQARELDPEFGFYRMYNFNGSGSFSTKIYGMFQPKRKPGKDGWLQAVRHVVTPSVGFTLAPDFTRPGFGLSHYVQTDSLGHYRTYNPNVGAYAMTPPGPQASINFSLSNQIEMKVKSKRDTSGVKKIPIIEQLSLSGSYNFLADSMNLSNISITLRTGNIFKNFGIQLTATWDPYKVVDVNGRPQRVRHYNVGKGKFGRIASTGWSFGYTFNPSNASQPAMNDINSGGFVGAYSNPYDMSQNLDPATRRQYMVASYYDFSIPWNLGFNYSVNYTDDGLEKRITQTMSFQGSVTLGKWGISVNGGFDIARGRLTPMTVNLLRDLHCWEMSFQWVPIGYMKSYMFHIGVKSTMLADLKYDKQSSRFDNLID